MYQSGFKFDGQLSVETAIQKGHLKKTWITHLFPSMYTIRKYLHTVIISNISSILYFQILYTLHNAKWEKYEHL
jgi:hypothetical protein